MAETSTSKKPFYMDTFRSKQNPAIAANMFKEYDDDDQPRYYYKLSRAWKSKTTDASGYSDRFYVGYAAAIAEVAEFAELTIQEATKRTFTVGKHLTAKLGERLSDAERQAITVEKYRLIEDDFTNIKERGEDRFWQTVDAALKEVR